VPVAWATGSVSPSDSSVTWSTASRFPNFIIWHSAIISDFVGRRRKLIFKLVVTASSTCPIAPIKAAYMEKSASPIMAGPLIVPPGRIEISLKGILTLARPLPIDSTLRPN